MDDDDFRRGRPSNHKQFDEGTALLAGDALIPMAFETLLEARASADPAHVLDAMSVLTRAMGPEGVCGGQAAEGILGATATLDDLRKMHAQKTGALFSAALLMPRALAGLDPDSHPGRAIATFAEELGSAFQVVDDLEDAIQDKGVDGNKLAHAPEDEAFASILRYLPFEAAREVTLERLRNASQSLHTHWGTPAQSLTRISDEVSQRLRSL